MSVNIKEKKNCLFFSEKDDHLRHKISSVFGLPVFNKPQFISKEEEHKYKTIEESGVLTSCILQSRQTLLHGYLFKRFLKNFNSKKQENGLEIVNENHKISKIGKFTLSIELFSFPETIFYLVKSISETNSYLLSSKALEETQPSKNVNILFYEKSSINTTTDITNNDPIKLEKDSYLLNSIDNSEKNEKYEEYNFILESEHLEFFEKYFLEILKDDPHKLEKTNKAMERLKIVSLNSNFRKILYLIINGQATVEQKTLFNLYMLSSQSYKAPSNYNEEKIKSTGSFIFKNNQCSKSGKNNEEIKKIKQKKKYEYIVTEIIFEFKENPGEKWIFPKDIITEKLGSVEPFELLASFIYTDDSLSEQFQPVTLKISSCTQKLWDFILKYSESREKVFETMSKILVGKRSERLYFQQRILNTETKTFKNELDEKVYTTPKNRESVHSQKRKTIDENDTVLLSQVNNKLVMPMTSKKAKTKRYLVLPKGWNCNACNTTETPLRRRGPDGPGTLCNACGVKWKGGKGLLTFKEHPDSNKACPNDKVT